MVWCGVVWWDGVFEWYDVVDVLFSGDVSF